MSILRNLFKAKNPTPTATQRQSTLPVLGSKGTMLDVYLSSMPKDTQVQQKSRFAAVRANFEFGLFIQMQAAEQIAGEAMQKGFTVWGNVDATSAFLYGAGIIDQDRFVEIMTWLRNAATPGQKIQTAIYNPHEPVKLIEVAV